MQDITILSSAARTATTNSNQQGFQGDNAVGAIFHLDITAVSGTTPSMTVKIQGQNPVSGSWYDIPGAAFAAKTAAATDTLVVHPSVTTAVGQASAQVIPRVFRAVATITGTTPSFTFSLAAQSLRG